MESFRGVIDTSALRNTGFLAYALGRVFIFFASSVPRMYVPSLVMDSIEGVSPIQAGLSITVMGVANLIGRLLAGVVDLCPNQANKINALAGLVACITMAFMPHCHNLFWIYSAVAAYGLLTGVMRTLSPSIMALIMGPDISSALGINMLIFGLMSLAGVNMKRECVSNYYIS